MAQSKLSLLFDLDGTLVDTDRLHFQAYQILLAEFDRSITMQTYKSKIMGASNEATMLELFPDLPVVRHRGLAERKEQLFRATIDELEPTPGALELIDWAKGRNIGMAVVTNAPRANAELLLQGLGLNTRLPIVVIGEELERGKPDPLPYTTGLARIGGHADHALAFEDSLSGVRSASAANIRTFGLSTALSPEALIGAGATEVIDDFKAPSLWRLLEAMAEGALSSELPTC